MAVTRGRFSKHQQGRGVAVDVYALSPQARANRINLTSGAPLVVQASTKYLCYTEPSTSGITVLGAYVTFAVAPVVSGGTSTLAITKYDTNGSTTTTIVTAATILSGYTAFIPVAQTLAATGITVTAGQSIVVTVTTSNNSVGTADVGAAVTLLVESVEDTIISDPNLNVNP